jgi:L-iditol 2-dehydrogenase
MQEVSIPEMGPDDVLVKISSNGICGSDIHFYEKGELGPFKVTRPYIPGHEACGSIIDKGTLVKNRQLDQRVAIEPGIPCRQCQLCKSGRYNLCQDVVFLSAPPVNGTLAEYITVPADFAHPLPDEVSDEAGAMVEPVSVGLQACNRARLKAADSVVILGAGPIGLVTFLAARAFGAAEIYLVDILDNRLDLGRKLGATTVINARKNEPVKAIFGLTKGQGVDVVFDTSGSAAACAIAPALAARGGTISLVGWPEKSSFDYPVETIIEKELNVHGVNRYCNTFPQAISLLAAGQLQVTSLITHRFPFKQTCDAFSYALSNRTETIKVMINH